MKARHSTIIFQSHVWDFEVTNLWDFRQGPQNKIQEMNQDSFLLTPTSCSKTLIVIWFPSIKQYPIEAGLNKNIDTISQLSVYFTVLSVKY